MRFLKFTLRICGYLLTLAVVLPLVVIAAMQVQAGRTFVSGAISKIASTPSQTITLDNLQVGFDLDAALSQLTIADPKGVWLEVNDLDLGWSPLRLIAGVLELDQISVAQVNVYRQPVVPAPDTTEPDNISGNSTSSVGLPLDITLKSLAVDEVNLGEPLIGAPVSLAATGSSTAFLDPAILSADIDIKRIDGVDGSLVAKAEFEPAADTLAFEIDVSEPRGGMVARLLQVAELPALSLKLSGDGPLTDWAAKLAIALDGRTTVTGSAKLAEVDTNRQLSFDLDGDLAPLAPPEAKAFLLGTTHATGEALFSEGFVPRSAHLEVKTQTVTLNASGTTHNGGVKADGVLAVTAGEDALIALDIQDRRIAFGALSANTSINGKLSSANWHADLSLASLQTTEARTEGVLLNLSGQGADLSSDVRSSPFDIDLNIQKFDGLVAQTEPLTGQIALTGTGQINGVDQEINLSKLSLTSSLAELDLGNTKLSFSQIEAQGKLEVPDLGKLSSFAGRDLAGSLKTSFALDVDPASLKGTASLAALTKGIETGVQQADAVLVSDTRLDTSLKLDGTEDITLNALTIKNDALALSGTAHYRPSDVVSDLKLTLADLSKVDAQLDGSLDLAAKTSGPVDQLSITSNVVAKQILLAGTPLEDLSFSVEATADPEAPTATIKGSASLNDQPITVDVELSSKDGGANIDPLTLDLAGNTVSGHLAVADLQKPVESVSGNLKIDVPDLSTLSPLALTDLGGRLQGAIVANPDNKQISLDLTGNDLEVPELSIGSLSLRANLEAPYDPKTLSADIEVLDLFTSATPIHSAMINAAPEGTGTALTGTIKMDAGTDDGLTWNANFSEPTSGSYLLALNELALKYQGISSQLQQPATISYSSGTADIQPLAFQLGNGSLSVDGKVGDQLLAQAVLKNVPLNLANAFVPSLGLGGTLSGTATASGSMTSPDAKWSLNGAGLTASELRANGLSALTLASTGSLTNNTISQSTKVNGANGLALQVDGTVGLNAPTSLSLKLNGTVPTASFRRPLLEAGLRAEGAVALTGAVGGTAASPSYQITATPSGLKVISLSTGLTVQNIRGSAIANQNQASLNGIAGDLATGGSLSASGTVALKDDFTAQLALVLDKARYVDPGLVTAEVGANIKVTGPLASSSSSALIGGTVTINQADVSIPESLPGAIPPVEVQHVHASKAIRQQVAELGGEPKQSNKQSTSTPPRLDILLSAPGRIFIRGRGLDAELQGNLKVVGTTDNPQAIGAFSLKRGQLDILTRRLTFSRGSATFEGSLTPLIDFAATTTVSDTTITVSVSGEADDPQIAFSSAPELPQDEVLALLLFGRSVGNLSATQIAQLAAAIATLTGGSDNGPLAQIRKSLGLDAIDINTDGEDGPSIGVGKYINDNIYLGVEQGTNSGSSRVKVDIDLDRGVKVRGEVGADGSSKAGIFFEREY